MQENIVNMTPHAITARMGDRQVTLPPSGKVARVSTQEKAGGHVVLKGLPFYAVRRTLGEVDIPTPDMVYPGDDAEPFVPHWILVSSLVLEAAKAQGHPLLHRLCAPDTGSTAIREGGQVVAVTQFVVA